MRTPDDVDQLQLADVSLDDLESWDPQRDAGKGQPDWISPEQYPRLFTVSAGHMYCRVLQAESPDRPEYVTVPFGRSPKAEVAIARWNMQWEAAQFRRRTADPENLPKVMREVADLGDVNVEFVPRTRSRYFEYAQLFHLLPGRMLERHGLPYVRAGQWPYLAGSLGLDDILPSDFEQRLSRAWADMIWRHLIPASPQSGFTSADPIRILAHNLDYWIPAATDVVQSILRCDPTVDSGLAVGEPPVLMDGSFLDGAVLANPRRVGEVWMGEHEALETARWVVDEADATGNLRGILDAVRSKRVEDDFSEKWTRAREDFERKLYRKRSKVQVSFVELTNTVPVQGPETEVVGNTVTADFMALLDEKQRQIVVLLNSGFTNLTEVGEIMGYSNHSPISKRLAKIRRQATQFFDEL